ncbi:hypothetical protein L228DRAFT_63765 [Xylona heveae TC161]|uniref:E3 ubiquitin-protein ligase listerin n=1 Tax=Xylona heveae (strain CBS 132557 / TC161) TaxID=1328760 RepID=A0A165IPL9_XYLHT|nr:hypothetical protein L228DRAFT_63765 [Xylona heveae TC161]KZF25198.1 hypothetical protein L228DRAFT_63765 [Xylona heveae TC161]
MSKRQFKVQASSNRATSGAFGPPGSFGAGFRSSSVFGSSSSTLSYISEPPDLSDVSEPNVVVAFKNLNKKDSTTKAKALDELLSHVITKEAGGVEEAVLVAWINLYPRTSIDNSRRVRQLAHCLQGQIASSCGKRLAKYMPNVAGSWLAGLYDNDKQVARAAQDSLRLVFNSTEKFRAVWKIYQQSILEYSRDAILRETVHSLSDERTVSPDEAEGKYARVVATSIALLTELLSQIDSAAPLKDQVTLEELLRDNQLWSFASHGDPSVRKASYKLLQTCVEKQRETISENLKAISYSLLSKALRTDQLGSAYEYVEALSCLTKSLPEIWTEYYNDKKPAITRLSGFLKKGSQGGGSRVWEKIMLLFEGLPSSVMPSRLAEAEAILDALLEGINRREEHPSDLTTAWAAYFSLIARLFNLMEHKEEKCALLTSRLLPIFREYVRPMPEQPKWSIGNSGLTICLNGFKLCHQLEMDIAVHIFEAEWTALAETVLQDVKISQPEQSKEYTQSQDAVAKQGNRLFALQAANLGQVSLEAYDIQVFSRTTELILKGAIETVTSRNGKPYGAAAVVYAAVHFSLDLILQSLEGREALTTFLERDLSSLLFSPSSAMVLKTLTACMNLECAKQAWQSALKATLDAQNSRERFEVLRNLLSALRSRPEIIAGVDERLDDLIQNSMRQAVEGEIAQWQLVNQAIGLSGFAISTSMTDDLLSEMVNALSLESKALSTLEGVELVARTNGDYIKSFIRSKNGPILLSNLLFLAESTDEEISHRASKVNSLVENTISQSSQPISSNISSLAIIQDAFDETRLASVSIESLVERAVGLLTQTSKGENATVAKQLLPNTAQWEAALNPFLSIPPDPSLAITDLFGSAMHMIQSDHAPGFVSQTKSLPRDINGYSTALRIAFYSTNVLKASDILKFVDADLRDETYRWLAHVVQLADDNLSVFGVNNLWTQSGQDIEAEILGFISETKSLMANTTKTFDYSTDVSSLFSASLENSQQDKLFSGAAGLSTSAFLNAKAFCLIKSDIVQQFDRDLEENVRWEDILRNLAQSKEDTFKLLAVLISFQRPICSCGGSGRLCNQLIANLTGHNFEKETFEGLRLLLILNSILIHHTDVVEGIPQQRLVFFIKHLIEYLQLPSTSLSVDAEIFRSFTVILPFIKGIYGSHWSQILDTLAQIWSASKSLADSSRLATIHSSLKLLSALRSLLGDESNDDLEDAWIGNSKELSRGLINLLKQSQSLSDDFHQPLTIVNELLARQISKLPVTSLDTEVEEIFPLLYAESGSIQRIAFDILHSGIPRNQERVSFDAALEEKDARLPEELLSLVLQPPTLISLEDHSIDHGTSIHLRGYLFSWILVFDHFTNSSYKVKMSYVENIKDGGYLSGLLNFATDCLGHAEGKPVDASKFDIKSYTPGLEETLKRDTQWMLIHLLYECLKYVPSLTKAWWIDCKSRQKGPSVEAWTEKYISPSVIADELLTVNQWITHQDSEEQLQVKVSEKAREVTASYEIDEQNMQIVIRLPGAYPLRGASVEGLNRVGVDEKRWRSWLLTTQGVITFSNGNLIDGLTAWKKNVVGALRGQTECAICYSIISADKQLPSKRCGTCKNLFHSLCLYKWFKSSNSSSCPLCRNSFNYS